MHHLLASLQFLTPDSELSVLLANDGIINTSRL